MFVGWIFSLTHHLPVFFPWFASGFAKDGTLSIRSTEVSGDRSTFNVNYSYDIREDNKNGMSLQNLGETGRATGPDGTTESLLVDTDVTQRIVSPVMLQHVASFAHDWIQSALEGRATQRDRYHDSIDFAPESKDFRAGTCVYVCMCVCLFKNVELVSRFISSLHWSLIHSQRSYSLSVSLSLSLSRVLFVPASRIGSAWNGHHLDLDTHLSGVAGCRVALRDDLGFCGIRRAMGCSCGVLHWRERGRDRQRPVPVRGGPKRMQVL